MNSYTDFLMERFRRLPPAVAWNHLENFNAATAYVAAGISVVPIAGDGRKRPDARVLPLVERQLGVPKPSWTPFQHRVPTHEELWSWFDGHGWSRGIGAVCGAVSGGLGMIDIDSPQLVEPWLRQVETSDPTLLPRLVLCRTPRPALHGYFRSGFVEKSQHLACVIAEVKSDGPHWKAAIETRGEGAYGIVPPSAPGCHPTYRSYLPLGERTLAAVETISKSERDLLFEVSRGFDQIRPTRRTDTPVRKAASDGTAHGNRPGDAFNRRADWRDLLQKHGWTFSHADGPVQYWRRPGKADGHSATLGHEGSDKLFVFSSNAGPLEKDRAYTKFEFVTQYEFQGDFTRAARELRARGYGSPGVVTLASSRRLRPRR